MRINTALYLGHISSAQSLAESYAGSDRLVPKLLFTGVAKRRSAAHIALTQFIAAEYLGIGHLFETQRTLAQSELNSGRNDKTRFHCMTSYILDSDVFFKLGVTVQHYFQLVLQF
jgi:hypothetical protein